MSAKRSWPALWLVLVCACEAEVTHTGDEVVLTMLPTTKALVLAVPGVLVLVGLLVALRRSTRRQGVIMMLATIGVAGLIVPGILLDRVTATPSGIWQRTGFWFWPNVKGFDYVEVRSIRIETRHERRRQPNDIWILTLKTGDTRELDPGDLWADNDAILLRLLHTRGIPVARAAEPAQ